MATTAAATPAEREQLRRIIHQWNENRLDLFSLTDPNEDLEFHGVMRFYFQDTGQKAATKCIRVSSTATTRAVIEALIEKFHPDLKMLTDPVYSLWEVYESGRERRLAADEKPLLVQLNWHKDDMDGRFVLKGDTQQYLPLQPIQQNGGTTGEVRMNRKLSKREKKELKKHQKRAVAAGLGDLPPSVGRTRSGSGSSVMRPAEAEDAAVVAGEIFQQVPRGPFTRTISNPEIVMKKRREQRLEKKLKDLGEGGSLKVYGDDLSPDRPYVTLLVSVRDRADKLVKETLDKYGLCWHHPSEYCLIETLVAGSDDVNSAVIRERLLADDECPLVIMAQHADSQDGTTILFHVRRRTAEQRNRNLSGSSIGVTSVTSQQRHFPPPTSVGAHAAVSPCLVELANDGSEKPNPVFFRIEPNVTGVGSDMSQVSGPAIMLSGAYVQPKHCVLAFMDGVVTLTPCQPQAEVQINGQPTTETTILRDRCIVRIARTHVFRFLEATPPNAAVRQNAIPSTPVSAAYGSLPRLSAAVHSGDDRDSVGGGSRSSTLPRRLRTRSSTDGAAHDRSFSPTSTTSSSRLLACRTIETTFGVDGSVDTINVLSADDDLSDDDRTIQTDPTIECDDGVASYGRPLIGERSFSPNLYRSPSAGRDSIPAIIELQDGAEDRFLSAIVRDANPDNFQFSLSPAYILYMACRYRTSPHYRVTSTIQERGLKLAAFLSKTVNLLHVTIQDHCHDATALAFWLSNGAELLNFMKSDRDVSAATHPEPQDTVYEAIEKAFGHLTTALRTDLGAAMPSMLEERSEEAEDEATSLAASSACLQTLISAMDTLRRCRMNAALTIQLFSQLFHYVNMFLFNWLVSREGASFCCKRWGDKLAARLTHIHNWALKQGLELAADCHLDRIAQAVKLLTTPKTSNHLPALGSTCYKLNSSQVRCLLERYRVAANEQPPSRELIDNLVKIAEAQADEMVRSAANAAGGSPTTAADGVNQRLSIQLEEDVDLNLPFLLPDDGYSTDVVNGIPPGLKDTVDLMHYKGICRMILQPGSSGTWSVHFISNASLTPDRMSGSIPEVVEITFAKINGGIGLSIVAAQGANETDIGIYVKKVVANSAAAKDGRLESGDKLLRINGQSLIGLTQEQAAQLMAQSGRTVSFEVAKQAASYNGLATWLNQPSVEQPLVHAPSTAHQRFQQQTSYTSAVAQQTPPYYSNAGGGQRPAFPPADYRLAPQSQPTYHQRSLSASNLVHDYQQQPPHQQQQQQRQFMGSLPRRVDHSTAGYRPIVGQSAQRPPSAGSVEYHHGNMQSPMRVMRSPNPLLTDYQNLPLISPTTTSRPHVLQPTSPLRLTRTHEAQRPPSLQRRSPHASSPSYDGGQHGSPSAVSYSSAGHVAPVSNLTVKTPPPTRVMPVDGQKPFSYGMPPAQQQPPTSPSALRSAAARSQAAVADVDEGQLEKQINEEVIRLMQDEIDRLEQKEFLDEREERRYRALKYELAYKQRLIEETSVRQRQNGGGDVGIHRVSDDIGQLEAYDQLANAATHSPTVEIAHASAGSFGLLPHRQAPIAVDEETNSFAAVEGQRFVAPPVPSTNSASMITELEQKLKLTSGDEQRTSSPKSLPPKVPPKQRRVKFDTPPPEDRPPTVTPPPMAMEEQQLRRYIYDTDDADEQPRVQVLGRQEVYRDPRQQRLNQLQQQQTTSRAGLDGSNLAFRDKMKLFAKQLGENTPKDRVKCSSAQRGIEETETPQ